MHDGPDHFLHRVVALVEEIAQIGGVAIDAENELGEVVAADGKAVEALRELAGEDHVRGDLAHHPDLQSVFSAP